MTRGARTGLPDPTTPDACAWQHPASGFRTSDEVCDQHAGKLAGFATWTPLYNSHTGRNIDLQRDIHRQYDQLREIDFAALEHLAGQLIAAGRAGDRERDEVNTRASQRAAHWSGSGAAAFSAHRQRLDVAAHTVDQDILRVGMAVQASAGAVRQVITAYGDTIDQLDWQFAIDPPLASVLIEFAKAAKPIGEVVAAACSDIGRLIGCVLPIPGASAVGAVVGSSAGEIPGRIGMSEASVLRLFAAAARSYLDKALTEPFEHNLELLSGTVRAAVEGVGCGFQPMIDAADGIDKNPCAGLQTPSPARPDPDGGPARRAAGGGAEPPGPSVTGPGVTGPGGVHQPAAEHGTALPRDDGAVRDPQAGSAAPLATGVAAAAAGFGLDIGLDELARLAEADRGPGYGQLDASQPGGDGSHNWLSTEQSGPGHPGWDSPDQQLGLPDPAGSGLLDTSTPQVDGPGPATFGLLHNDQPDSGLPGALLGGLAMGDGLAGGREQQRGPSQWRGDGGPPFDADQPSTGWQRPGEPTDDWW